ncbi:hypothetical protein B7993_06520 [Fibrobacter sp. UWH3]|nr:hypothetical protein B7993_06520 [Fibrobacter sp. UWH3]
MPLTELKFICSLLESDLTDEDETRPPPEDVSLSVTELEEIACSPSLLLEISATGSGPAPLELSSQAVKKQSAANKAPTKILRLHSVPLRMTLEEELPGSSVGDEVVKIEEDDTSAGFSSPDEPFAEVLSSQATRPKANAQVPRARNFFFMRDL